MKAQVLGILMAAAVAACSAPRVTGNAQGGVMPWFATNEREAFQAAQTHCSQFGKDARITQIVPTAGGTVTFDCVKA